MELEWDPAKAAKNLRKHGSPSPKPMKKNPHDEMNDELRPEYDLRELFHTGARGKYAKRYKLRP